MIERLISKKKKLLDFIYKLKQGNGERIW